ncbi:cell envelope integrity protein CreD [Aequorivita vladivostokensis]|uniref:Membrane protein n=1 Tax=Aequorivita vladivostokensis TaxID=171194 RepID=A0ABR5DFD1_9FLAO|nr:cell envelope integrity protein CreD [Aequorivita vladivostokensis]KJJ37475.1 membrane protein [Aequorivita vladivostokensis]MBF31923.1 cell envelope integrity protein CreD [Aequorivita sp.]|tara:strand:+ start:1798 stop:3147 length:1350 start_codon:yes stop_codon:yes gene_type:complete
MEQKKSRFSNWMRNSITARMLVVGFLLLVLLIPLEFVKSLINERAYRQEEVVREINEKWGNEVLLSGPIVKIPYKVISEEKIFNEKSNSYYTKTKESIETAYFFPDKLNIISQVDTKPLNRSTYESVVYSAAIDVTGNFPIIDFSDTDVADENILWEKATVLLKTSNLKGIKTTPVVHLASEALSMTPQYSTEYLNTIQSNYIANAKEIFAAPLPFSFDLKINGSESLKFLPIGKETDATMQSNWHSPSFDGNFLPEDTNKEISKDGFTASWRILQINRQFEQSFFGHLPDLSTSAFGTKLIIPVDEYQKSERTAKYGFMVIGLTLLVFLLIQLVSKIYIHPFQYVMIGLALVMFYTLLISISEHSNFFNAYAIAAISVLALITVYSRAILKGFKFPLLICASLASLYGFIYVIIQLENYALLVGSIGLFLILAIIMFASRRIDWNNES